jgi:hypothetical protein
MRGLLFQSDGKLKLLIEKDDPAVDFTLDESAKGFIEWGEITNSSKSNRYNRVICRYTAPDSGWTTQEVVWPEAGSAEETAMLAADNGVILEKSISLDTCIYYHEVTHHAKTICLISREQLRTSATWGPEAVILEVGDIVPAIRTAAGWAGKLFRIESTEKSTSNGQVELQLREHQPYIYDDANAGDKPVLPDTTITYTKPTTPSALTQSEVYNDFTQVLLSWTSGTTDHRIVIKDSGGNQIVNTKFAGTSFALKNYTLDTYSVNLYAIGGLGRQSESLDFTVAIVAPPTPTTAPTVTSKPGFITVEPPLPNATIFTYEWRWATSADGTNIAGGKDVAKTITGVIPDVTYTIEYRLVTPNGFGDWELVLVNGIEKTTYIWYVYADDDIGTGISLDSSGKTYFGIVGGKSSPTVNISDPAIFDYYIQPAGGAAVGDGITTQITKENILINTASDGTGGVFDGTTASTFTVLVGATDDTSNWTVTAADSASVTGSLTGTTYTVTALSADTGTITFTATRTDYPTLTKVVNVSKVRDGADGLTAYQIWINNGNSGTEADFLADLNGSDGIDGNEWHKISSGAPSAGVGSNNDFALSTGRYVYFKSGGSWAYQYDLKGTTGSAGSNGSDGLSAYQIWINNGNSGTEAAFLADLNGNDGIDGNTWHEISSGAPSSGLGVNNDFALSTGRYVYFKSGGSWAYQYDLKGADGSDGSDGSDGLSAYQIWLNNGGSGSEAAFLADLNGNDGIDGNTWHEISSGAPSSGLGVNNDFALSSGRYVYFKSGGSWAYQYDLKGADGLDGLDGAPGGIGPTGPAVTADTYSDSDSTTSLTGGSWKTISSITLPPATYQVSFNVSANARRDFETHGPGTTNLQCRIYKSNGSVVGGTATDTATFPSVQKTYVTSYVTGGTYTYSAQVYVDTTYDTATASASLTAVEQL